MKSKDLRKREAEERFAAWLELTVTERIRLLDKRLGAGKGAIKQRKRLKGAK
jgi:hypothetical protein